MSGLGGAPSPGAPRRPGANEIVIDEADLAPGRARRYGEIEIERERDTTTWKLVAAIWGLALALLVGGLAAGDGHSPVPARAARGTSVTTTTSPLSSLLGGL